MVPRGFVIDCSCVGRHHVRPMRPISAAVPAPHNSTASADSGQPQSFHRRRFRWRGAVGGVLLMPAAAVTLFSEPLTRPDSLLHLVLFVLGLDDLRRGWDIALLGDGLRRGTEGARRRSCKSGTGPGTSRTSARSPSCCPTESRFTPQIESLSTSIECGSNAFAPRAGCGCRWPVHYSRTHAVSLGGLGYSGGSEIVGIALSILAALIAVAGVQVLLFVLAVPGTPAFVVSLASGLAVLVLVERRLRG